MDESILSTIKTMVGLAIDYPPFDAELIIHVNAALGIANRLGIGKQGFSITGYGETWADFIEDDKILGMLKEFIAGHVRLRFDPPTSSIVVQSLKESLAELEWTLILCNDTNGYQDDE